MNTFVVIHQPRSLTSSSEAVTRFMILRGARGLNSSAWVMQTSKTADELRDELGTVSGEDVFVGCLAPPAPPTQLTLGF